MYAAHLAFCEGLAAAIRTSPTASFDGPYSHNTGRNCRDHERVEAALWVPIRNCRKRHGLVARGYGRDNKRSEHAEAARARTPISHDTVCNNQNCDGGEAKRCEGAKAASA